jgi:hypothetical protein
MHGISAHKRPITCKVVADHEYGRVHSVGVIFLTDTRQRVGHALPPIAGYDTVFDKPRTLYVRRRAVSEWWGGRVYVHNSLQHIVTNAERTTRGGQH